MEDDPDSPLRARPACGATRSLRWRGLALSVALTSFALCALACEGANVKVPVAPASDDEDDDDVDDDSDERPVACEDASTCRGEERICHRGFCVECVVDEDCPREGQYCEPTEFDCESRERRASE